eukprot:scaffold35772_cov44-Tisochrysis_lutea.AAC.1
MVRVARKLCVQGKCERWPKDGGLSPILPAPPQLSATHYHRTRNTQPLSQAHGKDEHVCLRAGDQGGVGGGLGNDVGNHQHAHDDTTAAAAGRRGIHRTQGQAMAST